MVKSARGIRNHNPGNIRKGGSPWQGMADTQSDRSFVQFKSPVWGIRAIAKTLITYRDRYGLTTVEQLISRWAPPNENKTSAYVKAVAREVGVEPTDKVVYADHLVDLIAAIIQHENGQQPYSRSLIQEAIEAV